MGEQEWDWQYARDWWKDMGARFGQNLKEEEKGQISIFCYLLHLNHSSLHPKKRSISPYLKTESQIDPLLWIEKIPVWNLFCITCSALDIMYCPITHSCMDSALYLGSHFEATRKIF